MIQFEIPWCEIRQIEAVIVYAIRQAPLQGVVAVLGQGDRESGANARDARNDPVLRQPSHTPLDSVERQLIPVGTDKVVS